MNASENLTLPELLAGIKDIAEPEPVSYLPQTAAWYILGIAIAALLLFTLWRLILRYRANRYRREALAVLANLERQANADEDQAVQRAALLRRTALTAYAQQETASLHGEAWLSFLDDRYGGDGFSVGPGRIIVRAPYSHDSVFSDADRAALIREVRAWIRRHETDSLHA